MTITKSTGPRGNAPLNAAKPREEVKAPKKKAEAPAPKPDSWASTTFEPSTGLQHTDGRLSGSAPYSQLPKDLKSKMTEKVWKSLPEGQRGTVVATYQKLKQLGVWNHVTQVVGEKEKREAHVKLPGGIEAEVAGNSGDIQYKLRDRKGFTEKLTVINPKFGVDGGVMGALHGGQLSMRESGEQTSLHISVGPGNLMDAHIDKVNPVDTPENGMTKMNLERGIQHWSTEVLPEMIRKFTGIPGVIVKPELTPGGRDQPTDARVTVNLELRFGGKSTEKKVKAEPMEGSPSVSEDVMKEVTRQIEASGADLPVPKGMKKGEEPTRQALAATIAAKIQEAVENGDSRINIDLVQYAGLKGLQKPVVGELRRIADIVRSELAKSGVDVSQVSALTVTFGSKKEGETVSILHNGE